MASYLRIKQILDEAVNFETFGAHRAFWRGLPHDQFLTKSIFGKKLIAVKPDGTFDPDESNIVKALEGRAPFGKDLVPPPAGAIWPRMPLGYPPVPPDRIQELRDWISSGCPEISIEKQPWVDSQLGGPLPPEAHSAFWRDFDDWAMFQASAQTQQDIDVFFSVAPLWLSLAGGLVDISEWIAAVKRPDVAAAVIRLSVRQRDAVVVHYGRPVPLLTLSECFEQFGDNSLPDDVQRPVDPRHDMNGDVMWFFWAAFADASLRLSDTVAEIPAQFWHAMARVILVGLLNDGVFRGRFAVVGFTADQQGKFDIRQHALTLPDADLLHELMRRCREGGFVV